MRTTTETEIAWEGEGVVVPLAHPITLTERRRWFGGVRVSIRRIDRLRLTPPTLADLEAIRSAGAISPIALVALCSDLGRAEAALLRWPDGEAALAALVDLLPPDFAATAILAPLAAEGPSSDGAVSPAPAVSPDPIDVASAETGDPGDVVDFFEKD